MGDLLNLEFSLSDVKIVPTRTSYIKSRKDVNVFYEEYNTLPVISSPMSYFTHLNYLYIEEEGDNFIYTLPRIAPSKDIIINQLNDLSELILSSVEDDYSYIHAYSKIKTNFNSFMSFLKSIDVLNKDINYTNLINIFNEIYDNHLNYSNIDIRIKAAKLLKSKGKYFIPSIGLKDNLDKAVELINLSTTDFYLIDVANGYMWDVIVLMETLKKYTDKTPIFGNIISGDFLYSDKFLYKNSYGVRVGIGSGSQCLTSINTSIGRPQFSAVKEVYEISNFIMDKSSQANITIINDGGVRNTGDMAVALLFSDYIMTNYLYKYTELNLHTILSIDNKSISYGMSSKYAKSTPDYLEGDITYGEKVEIKKINKIIKESLQSTLSYCGVGDIKDFDFNKLKYSIKLSISTSYNTYLQNGLS